MANQNHSPSTHGEEHAHHVSPLGTYYKTFAALIVLTILTVATSTMDFGFMNIVIAMLIATVKAALVVTFFMQLKYDDIGNKVTFASAFAFLLIFIAFTGADLFFRHTPEPVKVAEKVAAAAAGEIDQNKLRIASPELLKRGAELFGQQCATCHGSAGKGDGPAAAALNPKPRDFTSGYWKFGGSPTRVFHTISTGSPGTAMPPFSSLPVQDRYALAHYVRSISPNHPEDTPEDLKAAGLTGAGPGPVEKIQQEIPVETAMDKLEVPDQVIVPNGPILKPDSSGAKIYMSQCLNCHGVNGVGATIRAMGINPSVNLVTKSWVGTNAAWASNQNDFTKVVSEGFPGRGMPGMSKFNREEWVTLFGYVKELIHHQEIRK